MTSCTVSNSQFIYAWVQHAIHLSIRGPLIPKSEKRTPKYLTFFNSRWELFGLFFPLAFVQTSKTIDVGFSVHHLVHSMTQIFLLFTLIDSCIYPHFFTCLSHHICNILLAIIVRAFPIVMEAKEEVNIWHILYDVINSVHALLLINKNIVRQPWLIWKLKINIKEKK